MDFGATEPDMPAIEAYLRAARENTYEYDIGVYGCYSVVEEIAKRGVCKAYWQCVGWSGGKKSLALNVYQSKWGHPLCGISVDDNECADLDAAGIWNYEEENMTGEEIYKKLNEYLSSLPLPKGTAAETAATQREYNEAIAMGIVSDTAPMGLVPRYQAAIMAKRAASMR